MADTDAEVVRAPATDRPALSDATTAILLGLREQARPEAATLGWYAVLAPIYVAGVIFFWVDGTVSMGLMWSSLFLVILALPASIITWRASRWIPSAYAQLGWSPWRTVTARVVRARAGLATVEVEENGTFTAFEVRGLRAAHRSVIARTGALWLVGPAADGWAFARVDGSHEAFPARVRRKPLPPGAVSEPVAPAETSRRQARWLRSRVWRSQWLFLAAPLYSALYALGEPPFRWQKLAVHLGVVLLFVAWFPLSTRYRFGDLRLPNLVEAGEWTRAQAWAAPWEARLEGTAEATVTVRLDDGTTLTASLPNASVDLLGTVWDTGTLWFAGKPEAGKTMAAGFPGYPLLAVARLR
ncbi:hypothetical protein [Actinokineospora iranica]|uniref:Uncharacterized protein n=1 Tax=Actinokineospora iranica TaxID=1271860 RepID=A0A1G6MYL4_9PSEU|nr:hypothetical protein [Actinokineospora iranica]SDC60005.1 hypothetical protein SAMN05216174_10373 [Actinokineospora iranica]